MNKHLTEIQQSTLEFIRTSTRENGRCPSLMEITKEFGWKSQNSACGHVNALVRKGYLNRLRGASRSLILPDYGSVCLPEASDSEYWFEGVFQHRRYEGDVVKAVQAAGMKVKEPA
jgi:SOS-response transcriptional repressor LexA